MGFLSQKQIQQQRQHGAVLVVWAVAGHQQEQQDNQEISGVEIAGQQPPQKTGDAGIGMGRFLFWRSRTIPVRSGIAPGRRTGWLFWRLWLGWFRLWLRAGGRCRWRRCGPGRIRHPAAAVGAVGLGDVAVIHESAPAFSQFQRVGADEARGHAGDFGGAHGLFQLFDSLAAQVWSQGP